MNKFPWRYLAPHTDGEGGDPPDPPANTDPPADPPANTDPPADPTAPQGLTPEDVAALVLEHTERARAQWEAEQRQNLTSTNAEDAEAQRLADLQYSDPVAYQKEMLRVSTERAYNKARAEFGSRLTPIETETNLNKLSDGLGTKGREYLSALMPKISPEDLASKDAQDILRRAARDYERENTVVRENVPKTNGDPPPVRTEDQKLMSMFASLAGQHTGIDEKDLTLSDDEIRSALMTEEL